MSGVVPYLQTACDKPRHKGGGRGELQPREPVNGCGLTLSYCCCSGEAGVPFRLLETHATEWIPDELKVTVNVRVDARLVPSLASPSDGTTRSLHLHNNLANAHTFFPLVLSVNAHSPAGVM